MATPQSLAQLAELCGVDGLEKIIVQCFYCGKPMSWADKILFDSSQLPLVSHFGSFYGSCYPCVTANARLDFMINYDGVNTVPEIELQFRKPFMDLGVRCVSCLRLLTRCEKRDVLDTDSDLFVIRGNVRTLCIVCKVGLR